MDLYEKEIRQVVLSKKKELGVIGDVSKIDISKLGCGENNISILVKVNRKQKYVFRVGLKPHIQKNMKREFESLKVIPRGFGPKAIYFDDSKKILPRIYSVLSYVEGHSVFKWSKKHIGMHAKKLARLHKKRYDFTGSIFKKEKRADLYEGVIEEIASYKGKGVIDSEVKELIPKIKAFVKKNNYLFTSLKKFSRVHTDTCVSNILFSGSEVNYIDWEWMSYYDNSDDLAQLFSDVDVLPWRIKLTDERLDFFLNTYIKHLNFKDDTLKQRVLVRVPVIDFCEYLYFKWKIKNYDKQLIKDLPKKHYIESMKKVYALLRRRFLE